MALLNKVPENKNFLSPLGFQFVLDKTPNINYFAQRVAVPSITLGEWDEETPLVKLPIAGDKLRFEPLNISFKVSEDLSNYLEVFNWLVELGYPESFDQSIYKEGSVLETTALQDGTLIILTNHNVPNISVRFKNMFPIFLTELNFDSTAPDIDYIEATATFRYEQFSFVGLN